MSDQSLLRSESKALIKKYVDMGVLKKEQVYEVWESENYEQIMHALSNFLHIDGDKEQRIWMHVIQKVWVGCRADDELATVFSEEECIFFRELLRNRGVLTREHCLKRLFKTPHISDKTAGNLIEMEIIDSFKLRNYNIVYVLNLKFYQEAMKHGK